MKLDLETWALTLDCVSEIIEQRVGLERLPTPKEIQTAKHDTYILFSQLEDNISDRKDLNEYSGDDEELGYFLTKYIH